MIDTPDEIQQIQREIILNKSIKERFKIGAETIDFGREIVIGSIKNANPDISEIELKVAVFKRYYENAFSKAEFEMIIKSFINYYTKNKY